MENGVPAFWNIALQKSKFFFTNKKDEEVLKLLKDIRIDYNDDKVSFTVTLKFEPNDYFNNTEIKKTYFFNEDNELDKVESTLINWTSEEKNPMKELKKKQKKSKIHNKFQKGKTSRLPLHGKKSNRSSRSSETSMQRTLKMNTNSQKKKEKLNFGKMTFSLMR